MVICCTAIVTNGLYTEGIFKEEAPLDLVHFLLGAFEEGEPLVGRGCGWDPVLRCWCQSTPGRYRSHTQAFNSEKGRLVLSSIWWGKSQWSGKVTPPQLTTCKHSTDCLHTVSAGQGICLPPPGTDPLVVAAALKQFLLTLPEPLFTYK